MALFKTWSRWLLGLVFTAAGINHFANTPFYLAMVPPYLPWHAGLVHLSGLAEAGLGAWLLLRKWQATAAWGIVALCIAVFPANLHMALHPDLFARFSPVSPWLRLPFQGVLAAWAVWHARSPAKAT